MKRKVDVETFVNRHQLHGEQVGDIIYLQLKGHVGRRVIVADGVFNASIRVPAASDDLHEKLVAMGATCDCYTTSQTK